MCIDPRKQRHVNVVAYIRWRVDHRDRASKPVLHEIMGKARLLIWSKWIGNHKLAQRHLSEFRMITKQLPREGFGKPVRRKRAQISRTCPLVIFKYAAGKDNLSAASLD